MTEKDYKDMLEKVNYLMMDYMGYVFKFKKKNKIDNELADRLVGVSQALIINHYLTKKDLEIFKNITPDTINDNENLKSFRRSR